MSFYGWLETNGKDYGRWVCDCGAKGMRSMYGVPGEKLVLLLDHFDRMHEGRGTPVHGTSQCQGRACPFHNPTDHRMNEWPKHVRWDRCALVERICSHGIGHPDPDSLEWVNEYRTQKRWDRDDGTHGCDGCCRPEDKIMKQLNPRTPVAVRRG